MQLFSCCCIDYCRQSKKERALELATELYEQESDFVELIRQNRMVKQALAKLLSATEISELQHQAFKTDVKLQDQPAKPDIARHRKNRIVP